MRLCKCCHFKRDAFYAAVRAYRASFIELLNHDSLVHAVDRDLYISLEEEINLPLSFSRANHITPSVSVVSLQPIHELTNDLFIKVICQICIFDQFLFKPHVHVLVIINLPFHQKRCLKV